MHFHHKQTDRQKDTDVVAYALKTRKKITVFTCEFVIHVDISHR